MVITFRNINFQRITRIYVSIKLLNKDKLKIKNNAERVTVRDDVKCLIFRDNLLNVLLTSGSIVLGHKLMIWFDLYFELPF